MASRKRRFGCLTTSAGRLGERNYFGNMKILPSKDWHFDGGNSRMVSKGILSGNTWKSVKLGLNGKRCF